MTSTSPLLLFSWLGEEEVVEELEDEPDLPPSSVILLLLLKCNTLSHVLLSASSGISIVILLLAILPNQSKSIDGGCFPLKLIFVRESHTEKTLAPILLTLFGISISVILLP